MTDVQHPSATQPGNGGRPGKLRTVLLCGLCFGGAVIVVFVLRTAWLDALFAPLIAAYKALGLSPQIMLHSPAAYQGLFLRTSLLGGGLLVLPVLTWLILRQTAPLLFKPALIGRVWLLVVMVPVAGLGGAALGLFVTSPRKIAGQLAHLVGTSAADNPLPVGIPVLNQHLANITLMAAAFVLPIVLWAWMRVRDINSLDGQGPDQA